MTTTVYREVSAYDTVMIRSGLNFYKQNVEKELTAFVPVSFVTGISEEKIEEVMQCLSYIKMVSDILLLTGIVDKRVGDEILLILSKTFKDIVVVVPDSDEHMLDFNIELTTDNGIDSDNSFSDDDVFEDFEAIS